jgi:hypothetical protein
VAITAKDGISQIIQKLGAKNQEKKLTGKERLKMNKEIEAKKREEQLKKAAKDQLISNQESNNKSKKIGNIYKQNIDAPEENKYANTKVKQTSPIKEQPIKPSTSDHYKTPEENKEMIDFALSIPHENNDPITVFSNEDSLSYSKVFSYLDHSRSVSSNHNKK